MFRSIKWRLPFSYAAIALLAALALGVVLLTIVRGYYAQREIEYLSGNADAMGRLVADMLRNQTPAAELQMQLDNLAFISQVRLRVLDPNGDEHVASSAGGQFNVFAVYPEPASALGVSSGPSVTYVSDQAPFTGTVVVSDVTDGLVLPTVAEPTGWGNMTRYSGVITSVVTVANTPYGFSLNSTSAGVQRRSTEVVRQPLTDANDQLLGYIEVSQGPAYGNEIVDSVAQGWLIASGVAVVLAALAGWLISRRLTQPVLALTAVTQRMAAGDLAHRAQVSSHDEFGTLAHSFNDMADRVEATIVTLRHFIADAAHELHTPLTALHTELELAESRATAPLEDIRRARAQVTRLEELAQGLLDLSRVEAQSLAESTPLDLSQLVRELSEVYASQADQAGLTLTLDVPAEPITVRGQPDQLRRAIGNLLDNAIKFTPEGGTLRLGLQAIDQVAVITVEDTGLGIPAEDLAQLFGRFHRGRNASAYPGHGLGLAIVKAIAEAHGGTVHAENTRPGARFRLRLPRL